tara:strand:- start:1504 stop:2772 length:1269 start_codon:yes stop_codon:yes gene_type:complete
LVLQKKKEKALLVGVILPGLNKTEVSENLDELEMLTNTAGAIVIGRDTQSLIKINPSFFIGNGKAKQLIKNANELGANMIVFDDELSPAQIKNYYILAKDIKIIDRSGIILDIFKNHARTKEAKTQVELAYLQYLLPRLTRQWTHLERQMGGIGTRAGMGETQIEIDRRIIRTKITRLNKELIKIDKERSVQSVKRKNKFRVALVGYTNAGKSTLFKALSKSEVYIKDQLFATLDTTIRKVDLDISHSILLSDTVGFIRKLPHDLVASFNSTLKEVLEADLILKVFDISSPQIDKHFDIIDKVLEDLGASEIDNLIILNKVDLLKNLELIKERILSLPKSITISALDHLQLYELKEAILKKIKKNYKTIELVFSYDKGAMINYAEEGVDVISREYGTEGVKIKIRANPKKIENILRLNPKVV